MLHLTASLPSSSSKPDGAFARPERLNEVLLGHRDLSRTGSLDDEGLQEAARSARVLGLKTVLVWDVLASDSQIAHGGSLLRRLDPNLFDAYRVQDAGVAAYLRRVWPQKPLHLILETGNHNLTGIQAWISRFEPQRVVLSNEIPMTRIAEMRPHIHAAVEVMAMGRILIFYTPRKLVSPIAPEHDEYDVLQRYIVSEEDAKRFPLVENRHGTFMYYEKDLFLLPYLSDIEAAGVDMARLDLHFYDHQTLLPALGDYLESSADDQLKALKACLGPKLTRGFFKSNRTDKQFKRLRNPHLRKRTGDRYLGEVVETGRKKYLAMETRDSFRVGDQLRFINPEGEEIPFEVKWIRNVSGEQVSEALEPGLWIVNHGRRISSGSMVYHR